MKPKEIKLRELHSSDKSQLTKLANNKKIWDNLRDSFPYPYSEKDAELFINLTIEENPKQNFAIDYAGDLCGVVGLIIQNDIYSKSAEIGYWIGESFWGEGIATTAIELITNYGFEDLKLIREIPKDRRDNIGAIGEILSKKSKLFAHKYQGDILHISTKEDLESARGASN